MTIRQEFIDQITQQLEGEAPAFFACLKEPPVRGMRLNGRREAPPDCGLFEPVPWAEGAYYLPQDARPGAVPAHDAGAYYLQEPSAMAAARALDVRPGDRVLDLCAAPGGKATQLSEMALDGTLVANEIHPGRARVLSGNVERMGCVNTVVTCAAPEALARKWPGMFDRVLVDAPCSGEGMFRKDPQAAQEWLPTSPAGCARRQREILDCAAELLKAGGQMVYSTCTFNRLENDFQIREFLSRRPDFETVPFFLPGLPEARDGTLHIWPHQVRGEGHFIALLRKKGTPGRDGPAAGFGRVDRKLSAQAEEALSELVQTPVTVNGAMGETLLFLPAFVPDLSGIQVLRAGLHLGSFRGRVFVPDHALSHALPARTVFPVGPDEAEAFLRGETLPLREPGLRGFGVVTSDGQPLGWGKAADGQIKNHYPKGLRRR